MVGTSNQAVPEMAINRVPVASEIMFPHDVLKREPLPESFARFLQHVTEAKPVLSYVFEICAHEQECASIGAPCRDSLHHV